MPSIPKEAKDLLLTLIERGKAKNDSVLIDRITRIIEILEKGTPPPARQVPAEDDDDEGDPEHPVL